MHAATLSIGDELALGQCVDTNAVWLAQRLAGLGLPVREHRMVPDDRDAIAGALQDLARHAGVVIATGGLGPTADDLTRLALGDVVAPGTALVEDAEALAAIERRYRARNRDMPALNRVQALRPAPARMLDNPHGTAPGLAAEHEGTLLFALPGPPREMEPMFERFVEPALASRGEPVALRVVPACGLGESALAERLGDLMRRDAEPLVGTTASGAVVTARIRARGADAAARAEAAAARVRDLWAPYALEPGAATLAAAIGALLAAHGERMAACESCTAGLLAATLVDEPGASTWFHGGWVCYANERKIADLGVDAALVAAHGAVSAEVAAAMAEGGVARSGVEHAVAITGIAGPDGGTPAKPVGTVFVGLAGRAAPTTLVRRFLVPGDRIEMRRRTVALALQALRLRLLGHGAATPLLWEHRAP